LILVLNFSNISIVLLQRPNSARVFCLNHLKAAILNLWSLLSKYMLPLLEYCSPIWSPVKLHDIDCIENVRRSFTKKLFGLNDVPYTERLLACGLPSLELRRLWSDLVLCFNIFHGLICLNFNDFFVLDNNITIPEDTSLNFDFPWLEIKPEKTSLQ
jgi:hypothetical protein